MSAFTLSVTFLDHDQILPNRRPLPSLPHRRRAWHLPSMFQMGVHLPTHSPPGPGLPQHHTLPGPLGAEGGSPLAGGSPDERTLLQELPTEVQGDVLAVHHACARHGPSGRSQARGSAWPSLHIPPPPRLSLRPHVGDSKLAKDTEGRISGATPPGPQILLMSEADAHSLVTAA